METILNKLNDQINKESLFEECKENAKKCFKINYNSLQEEIDIPLDEIMFIEDKVSIEINFQFDYVIISTNIIFFDKNKQTNIGYYDYQIYLNGEFRDEFLVFY